MLVDTPGIFTPRRRLDRAMVTLGLERGRRAPTWSVHLVDAEAELAAGEQRPGLGARTLGVQDAQTIIEGLQKPSSIKAILALNKIDRIKRDTPAGRRPPACSRPAPTPRSS